MNSDTHLIFEVYMRKNKVRDYLRANSYRVHGVDNLETLKSILASGIRPGTQMANYEGQGLDSGPYILVYRGSEFSGKGVSYRPGDFVNTKVTGKPVMILFDVGEILDKPPIEELEKHWNAANAAMMAHVITNYSAAYNAGTGETDWKKFGELGGFSDRKFKMLENRDRSTSDAYFAALENENYQSKTSEDYANEVRALAAQYKIPVKLFDFDSEVDDWVFVKR